MPAFEYQTTGSSSIQTAYTYSAFNDHWPSLPTPSPGTIAGLVYVCHVRIAAGDNGFSEPRVAMQRVRALLVFHHLLGFSLDSQETVESLNSLLALSIAISSGSIQVRVDPADSATWHITGKFGLAAYPFRHPT